VRELRGSIDGRRPRSSRPLDFRFNFVKLAWMALTRRQREVFDFVRGFVEEHGYSPSLEEIGAAFGLTSVATVHKHVQHLVEKGLPAQGVEPLALRRAGRRGGSRHVALPLLGTVAAGAPIEAIEVARAPAGPRVARARGQGCFALRVRGDSMIDEQIRDGDVVVIEVAARRARRRDGRGARARRRRHAQEAVPARIAGAPPAREPAHGPIDVPAATSRCAASCGADPATTNRAAPIG
jgi:SOS-response transcriptional repressor LexA